MHWCVNKIILNGFKWKFYVHTMPALLMHGGFLYSLWMTMWFSRENFIWLFIFFLNSKQPPDPLNDIPTNVPMHFHEPTKIGSHENKWFHSNYLWMAVYLNMENVIVKVAINIMSQSFYFTCTFQDFPCHAQPVFNASWSFLAVALWRQVI